MLWDIAKSVLREKSIDLNSHSNKNKLNVLLKNFKITKL